MKKFPPERIVCLTEETVETIYLLGEEKRIVGVTGYATRPKRVRNEKPRISSFISANICLLYTSPSPRDLSTSRMPSSA